MKKIPDCTRELIVGLKAQSIPQHEIARRVGVSPATVSRIVGGSCNVSEESMRHILQAHAGGERAASIARRFGLHPSTVFRIVRGKTEGSRKAMEARG